MASIPSFKQVPQLGRDWSGLPGSGPSHFCKGRPQVLLCPPTRGRGWRLARARREVWAKAPGASRIRVVCAYPSPLLLLALSNHPKGWLSDISLPLFPPVSSLSTRSSMFIAWKIWSSSSPWSMCRSQTACYSECSHAVGVPHLHPCQLPATLAQPSQTAMKSDLSGREQNRGKYSETSLDEITEHSEPGHLVQGRVQ